MARMSRENSVFSCLSSAEAEKRLAKHGENILSHKKAIHPARIFAGQFKDFMVMILLGATVISVLMGEAVEALTICLLYTSNRGLFSILRKLGFFDHPFAKELVLTIQTISQTA